MQEAFPLHEAGRVDEAEALYHRILTIAPEYADAHYLLGRIAQDRGQMNAAIEHVRRAVKANSREPAFHRTLGELYYGLGLWSEAAVHLAHAAEHGAGAYADWTNLGCAYEKLERLDEAARAFEKALVLEPDSPEALNNVAMSLKDRGRVPEAIPLYRRARARLPTDAEVFSNLLYTLNLTPQQTPEENLREHLAFDRAFGTGRHGAKARHSGAPLPDRRLRIGYFSPDLRAHPVAVFVEPVLRAHDRSQFEVFAYNLYRWRDPASDRLRALCDAWIDCGTWDDAAIDARIRADRIDILVDLAGHTAGNRLPVLAHKPAPVIATWLGYPNTTGLAAVDYRITDAVADPPGTADALHAESLVRLPIAQWCYTRPQMPVAVTALPAASAGTLRFGSFNNSSKVNAESVDLWAQVLRRVPSSHLLLWSITGEQRQRIRDAMRAAGIDADRLQFSERTAFRRQLELFQGVDIALDTWPFSGVTTTFNSLWMGVPVMTQAGPWPASRSSASILQALGLGDWVAEDAHAYVERCAAHAANLESLAALRASLRERLERSPLMDATAFARALEDAYRRMWREAAPGGGGA